MIQKAYPKLNDEQRKLVEDNLNLVHHFLHNKFFTKNKYENYEDHFQDGCIGLCLAALRFDKNKGIAFTTFAGLYILGTMKRL